MHTIDLLFVCLHGSAKSVIAAHHCRRLAASRGLRIAVASAGLEPDDQLPDGVVAGLGSDGIEIGDYRPNEVSGSIMTRSCRVVAIGCDVTVPPGPRVLRWDDVPAVSDGYPAARDAIVAKLDVLLDELARERSPSTPRDIITAEGPVRLA